MNNIMKYILATEWGGDYINALRPSVSLSVCP